LLDDVTADIDVNSTDYMMMSTNENVDVAIEIEDTELSDSMLQSDAVDFNRVVKEPVDVEIEVVDLAQDNGMTVTLEGRYFEFILPPEVEYDVQVDYEDYKEYKGKAVLISSDIHEDINTNEILRAKTQKDKNTGRISVNYNETASGTTNNTSDPNVTRAEIEKVNVNNQGLTKLKKYTIQIMASRYPVEIKTHFKNLSGVQEYYCTDGFYRYVFGDYDDWDEAAESRLKVVDKGYPGSFIVRQNALKQQSVKTGDEKIQASAPDKYSIQLKESRKRIPLSEFKVQVREFYTGNGMYVYTTGRYKFIHDAKAGLSEMIHKGYKDAFIVSVDVVP
jgi:hypothetical protein